MGSLRNFTPLNTVAESSRVYFLCVCPKTFPFLIAAFSLLAGALSAAERIQKLEWPVGDHPIIKVETFRGEIRVLPSQSGQVKFSLLAEAGGPNAESWLNQISVQVQPFGAGMSIAVKRSGLRLDLTLERQPRREITLVLEVPQICSLDIKSESGRINVADDIKGRLRARASRGDVFFGRVGGSADIEVRSGNISVGRVEGDLVARNGYGDIQVGTVKGMADLTAEHGSIEVINSFGGLVAKATKGNIEAGMSRYLAQDSSLHAVAGNVIVDVDPDSALTVDARTTWGKVRTAVEVAETTGKQNKFRLAGSLNGGGPLLALKASGGNVHIRSMPTYVF